MHVSDTHIFTCTHTHMHTRTLSISVRQGFQTLAVVIIMSIVLCVN